MLTGTITGASRKDIIDQAREQAADYFGTHCLKITLGREEVQQEELPRTMSEPPQFHTYYRADYSAEIEHRIGSPAYGFPYCLNCKKQFAS